MTSRRVPSFSLLLLFASGWMAISLQQENGLSGLLAAYADTVSAWRDALMYQLVGYDPADLDDLIDALDLPEP